MSQNIAGWKPRIEAIFKGGVFNVLRINWLNHKTKSGEN